ncbi:hypothetical protein [Streptomyces sp. MZ04]|uniref:hypothetical protein n=1 Tax=Streptomyces sp. MZ04 TaxID=2559236 RepID=UPI001432D344|nr:hypothetical protein [Streptomyces sp. MZ04]
MEGAVDWLLLVLILLSYGYAGVAALYVLDPDAPLWLRWPASVYDWFAYRWRP